jgi:hypothetical protein
MAKKPRADEPDDEKPPKYEIDILGTELKRGSPHWLSPVERFPSPERKREIRDKHRARASKK